jgi:hypothetical protein
VAGQVKYIALSYHVFRVLQLHSVYFARRNAMKVQMQDYLFENLTRQSLGAYELLVKKIRSCSFAYAHPLSRYPTLSAIHLERSYLFLHYKKVFMVSSIVSNPLVSPTHPAHDVFLVINFHRL